VRLAQVEKGWGYESLIVDLANKAHLTAEYLAINPNGVVPTLVHYYVSITDSSVIVEYIDEVFADHPLVPKDPVNRASVLAWLRFLETVPTYAVRVPSFNKAFLTRFDGLTNEAFAD